MGAEAAQGSEAQQAAPPPPDQTVQVGSDSAAATMRTWSQSETPGAGATAGEGESLLTQHQQRVKDLTVRGGEGRKVEELMADDRFLDTLADKITMRLGGGTMTTMVSPSMGRTGGMPQMGSTWSPSGGGAYSAVGAGPRDVSGSMMRPDAPSFAEPADEQSRAELPRALMGGAVGRKEKTMNQLLGVPQDMPTVSDVNHFTQEKMRGECYVRLLINPEANAARKDSVPYRADTMNPDATLVAGPGRPNLSMPPKPPVVGADGNFEEDDEFADFERNDTVVFSFVRHNRYEAVEALIAQDHDTLVARDENGNSLLHIACQNNNRHIAKLLLKNGIGVNEINHKGNTPLHYCSQYGFMQLADYLLAHGADDTVENHAGFLPTQGTGGAADAVSQSQKNLRNPEDR